MSKNMPNVLIGQGNTAEIYEFAENKILKLYRKEMSKEWCKYEFEITKLIHDRIKETPKAYELVQIEDRIGGVYEQIKGRSMLKLLLLQPWNRTKYMKLFAQMHAKIHQIEDSNIHIMRVKERLKNNIRITPLLEKEEKEFLYQYIDTLCDDNYVCHCDYHPDNVMILGKDIYIIDWMNAGIGNPLSDVARTALILQYAQIPRVPNYINFIFSLFQRKLGRIYMKEYMRITKADKKEIQKWMLPNAAARLCENLPDEEIKNLLQFIRSEQKMTVGH